MDEKRYRFVDVRLRSDVVVICFYDTEKKQFTCKGMHIDHLDFLGSFDSAPGAIQNAFIDLMGEEESNGE